VSLATHVARLPGWAKETLTQDELDMSAGSPDWNKVATSHADLMAMFEKNVAAGRAALEGTTDATFMQPWSLKSGATVHFTMPKIAMIGAGAMVPLDIPPYALAWGDRARLSGLNLIGLRRRGLSPEMIKDLKNVYREVFDPSAPIKEHLARLSAQERTAPVKEFLSFIQASQRGICRPASTKNASSDNE